MINQFNLPHKNRLRLTLNMLLCLRMRLKSAVKVSIKSMRLYQLLSNNLKLTMKKSKRLSNKSWINRMSTGLPLLEVSIKTGQIKSFWNGLKQTPIANIHYCTRMRETSILLSRMTKSRSQKLKSKPNWHSCIGTD
jgi:hypothetical protein